MPTAREQIDPHNTLPQVELRHIGLRTYDKTGVTEELEEIIYDGEAVGICQITTDRGDRGWGKLRSHFDEIHIDEDKMGRGIGLATYLLAIERARQRGVAFETDTNLSGDAKRIWELLATRGVAQVIKPFGPHSRWADKYEGKYRVPAYDKTE